MSRVWSGSKQAGNSLLVLLAIADHASDEGVAWPAISTLAEKARVTGRTVQRILDALEAAGEIRVVRGGHGRKSTNFYVILSGLDDDGRKRAEEQLLRVTQLRHPKPDVQPVKGDNSVTLKGDLRVTNPAVKGDTATSPEPSLEPSRDDDEEETRAIANEIGNEAGVIEAEPPALFDGIAASIDDLPRSARRYRRQIEALMGAPPEARRQQAYRALRAGSLPPADVVAMLGAAEARAGPLATCAALVVTANTAESKFPRQRIAHFNAVLDTITDHVYRTQNAPEDEDAEAPLGTDRGRGRRAVQDPGEDPAGAGSQVPARYRGGPRGSGTAAGSRPKRSGELSGREYLERCGYSEHEIEQLLGAPDGDPLR